MTRGRISLPEIWNGSKNTFKHFLVELKKWIAVLLPDGLKIIGEAERVPYHMAEGEGNGVFEELQSRLCQVLVKVAQPEANALASDANGNGFAAYRRKDCNWCLVASYGGCIHCLGSCCNSPCWCC